MAKNLIQKLGTGIALTGLVAGSMLSGGCANQSAQPTQSTRVEAEYSIESEVYDFVNSLAEKIPKDFERSRSGSRGWIYHDKSLKVGDDLLIPGFPTGGEGRFVNIYPNGNFSLGHYWDEKAVSFGYWNKEIILGKTNRVPIPGSQDSNRDNMRGVIITYSEKNGKWMKNYIDTKDIKNGMKIEDIPIKYSKQVNPQEVKSYLELIDRLRETYSSEDRTDSLEFSITLIEPSSK